MNMTTKVARSRFYWQGLTLIPVWVSDHMPSKMSDKITQSFPKYNGDTVEV